MNARWKGRRRGKNEKARNLLKFETTRISEPLALGYYYRVISNSRLSIYRIGLNGDVCWELMTSIFESSTRSVSTLLSNRPRHVYSWFIPPSFIYLSHGFHSSPVWISRKYSKDNDAAHVGCVMSPTFQTFCPSFYTRCNRVFVHLPEIRIYNLFLS